MERGETGRLSEKILFLDLVTMSEKMKLPDSPKKPVSLTIVYEGGETDEVLLSEIHDIMGDDALLKNNMLQAVEAMVHKIQWLRWILDR